MTGEIPEARLTPESSVHEDVEPADAEEGRVPLPAREDVEGRVTEPDVPHHVARLQEVIQRHGRHNVRHVADEGRDGLVVRAPSFARIDGDLGQGSRSVQKEKRKGKKTAANGSHLGRLDGRLLMKLLGAPLSFRSGVEVRRDGSVGFVQGLHFGILEDAQEIRELVHPVLDDPGAGAGEGVARVNDVSVTGEGCQEIPHALLQGAQLGVDEDLRDEGVGGQLDQFLSWGPTKFVVVPNVPQSDDVQLE